MRNYHVLTSHFARQIESSDISGFIVELTATCLLELTFSVYLLQELVYLFLFEVQYLNGPLNVFHCLDKFTDTYTYSYSFMH